jgi:hypothetical protein
LVVNTPVIKIPVDDSAFKKFHELFLSYTEKVEEMPDAWKKLDAAMGKAGDGFGQSAATAKDALAIAATQTAAIVEAITAATKAQNGFSKATHGSASAMFKLGAQVKSVAGEVAGMGKWLLKMGGITGTLAGIGGGLGVYDLAGSVLSNQRQAGGLGLSVGQMRSWQANMSPFVGANVLQGAAGAQLDPSKYGYLAALGISGQQASGESATSLATQISNAARRAYQQNPNVNSAQAQSFFALGGNVSDWRNLGTANGAFLASSEGNATSNAGALGYSAKTAQAWQQLSVQLSKAGYQIQSSLIDGLEPLAPMLTKLSAAVSDGISAFFKSPELKADLQQFTDWLSSPGFTTDLKAFGDGIKTAGADVLAFLGMLGKIPGLNPSAPNPTTNPNVDPTTGAGLKKAQQGGWGSAASYAFGPDGGKTKATSMTGYSQVMKAFEGAGYSTNFAAAMASQFGSESGFNASASSYDKKTGWHKGLGQWSADRRAQILRGTNGKIDVWSSDPQMGIAGSIWELQHTQTAAAAQIAAAAKIGPGQAGIAADKYYEVSGDGLLGQAGRGLKANLFAQLGPQSSGKSSTPPELVALLKRLAKQGIVKPAHVTISNSTSARVSMSANAAAFG